MEDGATQPRIGRRVQRVERAEAEDLAGVDRVRIADQGLDSGNGEPVRAGGDRRAGRGAGRCGNRRGGRVERGSERQPMGAAGAHRGQRRGAVPLWQAGEQVRQAVQPARGDGFRLGIADGAGQHDLGRGDGLLIVMRGQADLAFGQQKAEIVPHLAVQPGVRRGLRRPDSVVEAAEDDEIGLGRAGLQRAADEDRGVDGFRAADGAALQDGEEQGLVVEGGKRPAGLRLAPEFGDGHGGFAAGCHLPEAAGAFPEGAAGQCLGAGDMAGEMG